MGYKPEVFHGLPQSLQETARIVSRATTTPHSFATHHSWIILPFKVTQHDVLTAFTIINGRKYTDGGYDLPYKCPQILEKSRSCHQILGVRRVTLMKFHVANPQFCSHLWIPLLSGTFCLVHVKWYTHVHIKKKKNATIMLTALSDPAKHSVTQETKCTGLVPLLPYLHLINASCTKKMHNVNIHYWQPTICLTW